MEKSNINWHSAKTSSGPNTFSARYKLFTVVGPGDSYSFANDIVVKFEGKIARKPKIKLYVVL